MRYAGLPSGLWLLFARSYRKNLTEVLHVPDASQVMRGAKKRYREIIAGLPAFEKGDRFQMNLVSCAMLTAILLQLPDKQDVETLAEYYERSQMTGLTRLFCRLSAGQKFSEHDIRAMRETEKLRAGDRNPYSWNMEFYTYADGSGYEARFTHCGICTLMHEYDLAYAVPAMCAFDYAMSAAGGRSKFVRQYTLGSGGSYCDCGYIDKRKTHDVT